MPEPPWRRKGSLATHKVTVDLDERSPPSVATFCVGQAASMASLLLATGAKGTRHALPHARVMIHQPLGGLQGQATDIAIHARETLKARDTVNAIYAQHTGQSRSA